MENEDFEFSIICSPINPALIPEPPHPDFYLNNPLDESFPNTLEDKMAKKGYKVEIAQKPAQTVIFEDKEYADAYGVGAAAWTDGVYTVTTIMYEETVCEGEEVFTYEPAVSESDESEEYEGLMTINPDGTMTFSPEQTISLVYQVSIEQAKVILDYITNEIGLDWSKATSAQQGKAINRARAEIKRNLTARELTAPKSE